MKANCAMNVSGWLASALLVLTGCDDLDPAVIDIESNQTALHGNRCNQHQEGEPGTPGLVDGTTMWEVPATANGLQSNQSWFSVAGAPDGNIYVGVCDHISNSALFRVTPENDYLSYLGDALAASEAADNVLPGETFEKFHVRPLWYKGNVYVATADYSNQDDLHQEMDRGYHWYSYNTFNQQFTDLSVHESNGVSAEHVSLFSTVLDKERGVIYGIGSPTAHLYRFDIHTGLTTDLGRSPLLTRTYYNPGRYIWMDSRGRVYLTVNKAGTVEPGQIGAPKHVLYWDPVDGWGDEPTWTISEMLRTGQCTLDGKRCYILDYKLNLYRFDDEARTFVKINTGVLDEAHQSPRVKGVRVRSMNLSANEKKIYFINDTAEAMSLYEWDFEHTSYPLELSPMPDLDNRLDARYTAFTGHDSWDPQGRFYFTGFGGEGVSTTPNVYVMRVDPVRLKSALGVIPGVSEITMYRWGHFRYLIRRGDLTNDLEVILRVGRHPHSYQTVLAPAGQVFIPLELGCSPHHANHVKVIPDGDTYVVRND